MESKTHYPIKKIKKIKHLIPIVACEQKGISKKNKFLFKRCFTTRFLLQFMFRRDQNKQFSMTSKITKMCEQILK